MYTTQGTTGVALRRKVTEQRPAGAGIIVTRGGKTPGSIGNVCLAFLKSFMDWQGNKSHWIEDW